MPIVTLLSDFGISDHYVAAMKAAVLRIAPQTAIVDISHDVPPQNILAASFLLERAIGSFDAGSIHVAVIDPGVGTQRRLLAFDIHGRIILCPDNGLITWAWRRIGPGAIAEITWRPPNPSGTFHGRDVLAPVAGRLAAGEPLDTLTRLAADPVLLPFGPAAEISAARVIYIDHFGNAVTNVSRELVNSSTRVWVGGNEVGVLARTYADVDHGEPVALINSSGLLEVAVRNGSAARLLELKIGQEVHLR